MLGIRPLTLNPANPHRNTWPDDPMNRISNVVAAVISSLVVSAIFFSISAYNDFPVSNQNMHALHASVLSGFTPALSEDWLYKTTDPYPLATWITALFLKLGPGGVYFLYFVVIAAFMLAVMTFLDSRNDRRDALASYLWSGLTVLSALVLGRLTGLSAGVADQYILGGYWQPSEAGVILVISVLLFASRWPVWSAMCAALAVALHPSHSIRRANLSNGCLHTSGGRAAVEGALYSRRSVYSPSVTPCGVHHHPIYAHYK